MKEQDWLVEGLGGVAILSPGNRLMTDSSSMLGSQDERSVAERC
jgi:hypothetical protein